jgi:CheY-like chemotaxis protein
MPTNGQGILPIVTNVSTGRPSNVRRMFEEGVILLAEDQEDDILLIRRAFAKGNIPNPIYVVRDGEQVISYLKGDGKFSNRDEYPLPDLLLLDLKMPKKDGFEVLRWIRRQSNLSALRVLVLTASEALHDVNLAYRLGANSFLVKPAEFENCVQLGSTIREYWLKTSQTPEIIRSLDATRGSRLPPRTND